MRGRMLDGLAGEGYSSVHYTLFGNQKDHENADGQRVQYREAGNHSFRGACSTGGRRLRTCARCFR